MQGENVLLHKVGLLRGLTIGTIYQAQLCSNTLRIPSIMLLLAHSKMIENPLNVVCTLPQPADRLPLRIVSGQEAAEVMNGRKQLCEGFGKICNGCNATDNNNRVILSFDDATNRGS